MSQNENKAMVSVNYVCFFLSIEIRLDWMDGACMTNELALHRNASNVNVVGKGFFTMSCTGGVERDALGT